MPEDATVEVLKEIEYEDSFSAARFSTDYGRMGVFGQELISIAPTLSTAHP